MRLVHAPCLSLLMLLAATSGAEDKPAAAKADAATSDPLVVRVEKCFVVLRDKVTLAADQTGVLRELNYKEGEPVAKGALVAQISDDVPKAKLAAAKKKAENDAEIKLATEAQKSAEAELNIMEEANRRGEEKNLKGIVSDLEITKAKMAVSKATVQIEYAQKEREKHLCDVDIAEAELRNFRVFSEFDGVVTKIYKKKGEAVKQGEPIADVVNNDRVRIEGNVQLKDLRFVKQGAKVVVRLSIPDLDLPEEKEEFEGFVTFIDLESSKADRTTRIHAEVANRNNILRAGLLAEMQIQVGDGSSTTKVIPNDDGKSTVKISKATP